MGRTLTPGARAIDAICEEGFELLDDILEPERFYGADRNGAGTEANQDAINDDIPRFLDPKGCRMSVMRQYVLRELR